MAVSITDPEQWNAAYEAASAKQQYDMLLETIAQPLTLDLIEDLDLGMLLVMMRDELINHNLVDQATILIQRLWKQQPELHQQEFPFLDNFLVHYALYQDDQELLQSALQQFVLNPTNDIDQTFAIIDCLKFYNATDAAVALCRAAYEPARTSNTVLMGAEMHLSQVLLSVWLQQAYQELKAGSSVDWDAFLAQATQYGFENKPKWVAEVQRHLTSEIVGDLEFFAQFKRNRREALRALSLAFCREMSDRKQMGFVCSLAIWQAVNDFLDDRNLSGKKQAQPEIYFGFTQPELDQYVAHQIGGLLSMQQSTGVALLWGIPYVYDLLRTKQIISDAVHQSAIAIVQDLKATFVEGYRQLWKYDFVHRWLPPDSVMQSEFEQEAQQFAASLEQVTPLSDEPGQGVTHQSVIESFKQQLPPELITAIEQMVSDNAFEDDTFEDDDDDLDTDDWVEPPPPSFQPTKPRKSSLRLTSELSDKKRSTKKRNH